MSPDRQEALTRYLLATAAACMPASLEPKTPIDRDALAFARFEREAQIQLYTLRHSRRCDVPHV